MRPGGTILRALRPLWAIAAVVALVFVSGLDGGCSESRRALRLPLADDSGALSIASREEMFCVDVDTDSEMGRLGLAFHPAAR
jgi:hypothetical protein